MHMHNTYAAFWHFANGVHHKSWLYFMHEVINKLCQIWVYYVLEIKVEEQQRTCVQKKSL